MKQYAIMDDRKKQKIQKRDTNGELIYNPPHEDTLYTIDELNELLTGLAGHEIPEDKRNPVQTSHWVKRKALELLGYKDPQGFRTKIAKKHKPKFIHQVMDVFVQSRDNLQIWGYIPYTDAEIEAEWRYNREFEFSETRIVIVRLEDYVIRGVRAVKAEKLADWDATGTETFKWQAFIPDSLRQSTILETGSSNPIFNTLEINKENLDPVEHRLKEIKQEETSSSLASKKPDPRSLLTIDEIGGQLQPLVGEQIPNKGERVTGQLFEKEVAKRLGYKFTGSELSADTGTFPDIRHQFIEIKFQDSPTIDLGRHHPSDEDVLEFDWNEKLAPQDARYVVGLANETENKYRIGGIIVVSGDEFSEFFSITEGTNSKIQMTIPGFDNIGDDDVELKSETDDQSDLGEFN